MIKCCKNCAKKLEASYIMLDYGGRTKGSCPLCWKETDVQAWEITPRKQRYPQKQGGGGERKRAGR